MCWKVRQLQVFDWSRGGTFACGVCSTRLHVHCSWASCVGHKMALRRCQVFADAVSATRKPSNSLDFPSTHRGLYSILLLCSRNHMHVQGQMAPLQGHCWTSLTLQSHVRAHGTCDSGSASPWWMWTPSGSARTQWLSCCRMLSFTAACKRCAVLCCGAACSLLATSWDQHVSDALRLPSFVHAGNRMVSKLPVSSAQPRHGCRPPHVLLMWTEQLAASFWAVQVPQSLLLQWPHAWTYLAPSWAQMMVQHSSRRT